MTCSKANGHLALALGASLVEVEVLGLEPLGLAGSVVDGATTRVLAARPAHWEAEVPSELRSRTDAVADEGGEV